MDWLGQPHDGRNGSWLDRHRLPDRRAVPGGAREPQRAEEISAAAARGEDRRCVFSRHDTDGSIRRLTFLSPPLGNRLFPYVAALALVAAVPKILWLIVFAVP